MDRANLREHFEKWFMTHIILHNVLAEHVITSGSSRGLYIPSSSVGKTPCCQLSLI